MDQLSASNGMTFFGANAVSPAQARFAPIQPLQPWSFAQQASSPSTERAASVDSEQQSPQDTGRKRRRNTSSQQGASTSLEKRREKHNLAEQKRAQRLAFQIRELRSGLMQAGLAVAEDKMSIVSAAVQYVQQVRLVLYAVRSVVRSSNFVAGSSGT